MIIKELNLIGFGKYINKKIELEKGINIIYGENEAGKTTIHSFIDGMFYGFLKPYAKTTRYLEEHEKYKPWSGTNYSGTIKFNHEGEDYIIEREFTRGRESSTVYLEKTGQEITRDLESNSRGRVLQPGYNFFGFNDAVYSNTISIKQLGSRTDDNLANELRDRLANTATSLDEDLSIEKALEDLDNQLKEIGSDMAPTRPYGRTLAHIKKLKEERDKLEEYRIDYERKLEEDEKLQEKLEEENKKLSQTKSRLEEASIRDKRINYESASKIKEEIERLEGKSQVYQVYSEISRDDYIEASKLSHGIDSNKRRLEDLNLELEEVAGILETIQPIINDGKEGLDIGPDYFEYEELEEERIKLSNEKNNNKEFLKRDLENKEKDLKNSRYISGISIVLGLALSGLGLVLNKPIFLIGLIIPLLCLVIIRKKSIALKLEIDNLEKDIKRLVEEEKRLEKSFLEIGQKQKSILNKYSLSSRLELKELYDDNRLEIVQRKDRKERLEDNQIRRSKIFQDIRSVEKEIKDFKESLKKILDENNFKNLDNFKKGLEKKEAYQAMVADIKEKNYELDRILGSHSLEELENDLSKYEDIEKIEERASIEDLEGQLREKEEDIRQVENMRRELGARLDGLHKEVSRLIEVDEEIQRKKDTLEELASRRRAIELAKTTIEKLSQDIHRDFAPHINKKVGRIIEKISNGNYKTIKLDDKLSIGLVNEDNGRIIDIESLSGGTIDQIYFALRFGIIDSMADGRPPLILDDCFIQYDDNRLKNMMNYLVETSKERQIILFTCHKREFNILNNMDINYNLIKL